MDQGTASNGLGRQANGFAVAPSLRASPGQKIREILIEGPQIYHRTGQALASKGPPVAGKAVLMRLSRAERSMQHQALAAELCRTASAKRSTISATLSTRWMPPTLL